MLRYAGARGRWRRVDAADAGRRRRVAGDLGSPLVFSYAYFLLSLSYMNFVIDVASKEPSV